jgi:hypothetical protein
MHLLANELPANSLLAALLLTVMAAAWTDVHTWRIPNRLLAPSTDFQQDRTELVFVVTPRLIKPLPQKVVLPTDSCRCILLNESRLFAAVH